MLKLKDINKTYKAKNSLEVKALRGISYEFPEKGLIFIVGKSGSGKSTMLNILGLLDSYDSGELIIDGKCSKEFSQSQLDSWRAINIGFIFQDFHIIENYTISKNISLPMEIAKQPINQQEISAVLNKVGLNGFEDRKSLQISGGQRQRVAIARALIKNPKIILADEPTGSLDSENGAALFDLLKELGKEKLIIVISHDIESAHRYADKIIELSDGKIIDEYQGEGLLETVKISTDKLENKHVDDINLMLGDNKRVLLSRPQQKDKPQAVPSETKHNHNPDKKPSLPIKNAIRLALLNIKSKWLKTFWMVLIMMFAVAFFGFSDIVGRFDINDIMAEEIQKTNLGFVNVASYKVDESGFLEERSQRTMTQELMTAFEGTGIEHIKKYRFTDAISPMLLTYQPFFMGYNSTNFFDNTIAGVIETDDLSVMGLSLSQGRMPENLNEVVITNYQLERYKLFGLNVMNETGQVVEYLYGSYTQNINPLQDGIPFNHLNSFDDIYEKSAIVTWPKQLGKYFCYKIVGVIDFDLSQYKEILSIKTIQPRMDSETRKLMREAEYAKSAYLNNFFVLPGFYKEFSKYYASLNLSNYEFELSIPDSGTGQLKSTDTTASYRNPMVFPLTQEGVSYYMDGDPALSPLRMNPEITASDIASDDPLESTYYKKQCIISVYLLWDLLDVKTKEEYSQRQQEYYEDFKDYPIPEGNGNNWPQAHAWALTFNDIINELDIFDGVISVSLNTSFYGTEISIDKEEYEIVGIYSQYIGNRFSQESASRYFIPTSVFFEEAEIMLSDSFIVPVSSKRQAVKVLETLEENGRYLSLKTDDNGDREVYRFMVISSKANEIYSLDVLFKLFVSIFRVLSIVLCFFAVLVCYNFISNSINSRKKDIGILRSLGASGYDVGRIFMVEGIIITALVIIFGILTCGLGYYFVNKFFILQIGYLAEEYTLIRFGLRQIILMAVLTIGAVALSIVAPIIRIAKKQPIDVIRN